MRKDMGPQSVEGDSDLMKRYPLYKDSGDEWIGKIPDHWDMKRIKYIANLIIEKAENTTEPVFKLALENIESPLYPVNIKSKEITLFISNRDRDVILQILIYLSNLSLPKTA